LTLVSPGAPQTESPVAYDHTWWSVRYPELAAWTSPGAAQGYFDLAQLYLDNTACSPARDVGRRQILLGLLVAHIAALNAPINGVASGVAAGRVASAGEGSVNVSFDYPQEPGAEWYTQTKYGAAYWAATAGLRMGGRYYPGPQPFREGGAYLPAGRMLVGRRLGW
jgi:hypothetical protein